MQADMWSLGILSFVLTMGTLPWQSEDVASVTLEILSGVIVLPDEIPLEISELVRWCTRLDPAARPTPTQLLQLPWIAEEQAAYHKTFGGHGRLSGAGQPSFPGIGGAKPSVKLILSKPLIRPFNSEKVRTGKSFGQHVVP
jgi:serine/threonine protein kinase